MTDPELLALLDQAKGHKMTPEEIREQRISFVYGNVAFENPTITREQVEAILFGEPIAGPTAPRLDGATAPP